MRNTYEVDELKAGYDLNSPHVVRRGPGWTPDPSTVMLDEDVAAVFQTSEVVNKALRKLIQSGKSEG